MTRAAFDRGFTLIELMVVVSLVMLLATIGMAQYRNSIVFSRESVLKEDLFRIRDAIDQYYADKGQYPSTLDALVSDGYLRKIPKIRSPRAAAAGRRCRPNPTRTIPPPKPEFTTSRAARTRPRSMARNTESGIRRRPSSTSRPHLSSTRQLMT